MGKLITLDTPVNKAVMICGVIAFFMGVCLIFIGSSDGASTIKYYDTLDACIEEPSCSLSATEYHWYNTYESEHNVHD